MRIEQIGRTAGEPRVAGGVGLGKVESGGTPVHTRRSLSICARAPETEQDREGQRCGGAQTHCHWHLSQVVGVAAMAGSLSRVSLVAMARSHDCGELEGGAERTADVGPARRSSADAPLACMAKARLTARRHEKAPPWTARMVLPQGRRSACQRKTLRLRGKANR